MVRLFAWTVNLRNSACILKSELNSTAMKKTTRICGCSVSAAKKVCTRKSFVKIETAQFSIEE